MTESTALGSVRKYRQIDGGIEARLDHGLVRLECLTSGLYRLRVTRGREFGAMQSLGIVAAPEPSRTGIEVVEAGEEIRVGTVDGAIGIGRSRGGVSLYDRDGTPVGIGSEIYLQDDWLGERRRLAPEEELFGLGERMTPLGRRGYRIDNFNWDVSYYHSETTERMYTSIPFVIGLSTERRSLWALLVDSPYQSIFDAGYSDWERLDISVRRGEYRAYLICASSLPTIVRRYTDLTGRHALPPIWALGNHQCRYSYMSSAEANRIADSMRTVGIPCDAIWYDIHFMDNFRIFTLDESRFDRGHFRAIGRRGFRSVVIVDPGIKNDPPGVYSILDEGVAGDHFLKESDGADFVGVVWPGGVRYPDFSNPKTRSWWAEQHRFYFEELGIDAIWNDMNEPANLEAYKTIPDHIRMYDEGRWSNQLRMHNLYALLESEATIDAFDRYRPNQRPFIVTRAGSPGIQRNAAVWTGDNSSTWHHLRMSLYQIINLGLSGIGFCGADVGGFFSNATPELLARWYQLGAFYPLLRNHSAIDTARQEPWAFDDETTAICKQAIELRYSLIPYIYQLFYELHTTGAPIVRPMFWHDRSPEAFRAPDQFLFGNYLLAAPIVERGQREKAVWLPAGQWYDWWDDAVMEGGRWIFVPAPLQRIPLFAREGSIIPFAEPMQCTAEFDPGTLCLHIRPFRSERTPGFRERYYMDDGETTDYLNQRPHFDVLELSDDNRFSFRRDPHSSIHTIVLRIHRDGGTEELVLDDLPNRDTDITRLML